MNQTILALEWRVTALLACLAVAATFVISNGHVSNGAFFLLFFIALLTGRSVNTSPIGLDVIFLFVTPIAAVLIGQLLRAEPSLREFDAPSRLLAALLVYRLATSLKAHKGSVIIALSLGCAAGLALVLLFLDPKWISHYGGRFATSRSAPNDLGGYSGLLLVMIIFAFLATTTIKARLLKFGYIAILSAGVVSGIYVVFNTQSRGPWLVTALALLMVFCWAIYHWPRRAFLTLLIVCAAIGLWVQTASFQLHKERVYSTLGEPMRWFTKNEQLTSGGARLSMIPASKDLFLREPIRGYGDFGYSSVAASPEFKAKYGEGITVNMGGQGGPHNEIAARSLQSGIWGLIATLFLLVYPVYRFGRQTLQAQDEGQRDLSFMGFVIFSYIFLLSFVLEPYSLKHTATFNALLLAVLLGATRIDRPAIAAPERSNA